MPVVPTCRVSNPFLLIHTTFVLHIASLSSALLIIKLFVKQDSKVEHSSFKIKVGLCFTMCKYWGMKLARGRISEISFVNTYLCQSHRCQDSDKLFRSWNTVKGCLPDGFCTVRFPSSSIMGPPPITELVQY